MPGFSCYVSFSVKYPPAELVRVENFRKRDLPCYTRDGLATERKQRRSVIYGK